MNRIFFILFALAAFTGTAQVRFSASLDTNRIVIGQQTHIVLKAENIPQNAAIVWPLWPDTLTGIELVGVSSDTATAKGLQQITQRFLVTSFDSGYVLLPPFVLLVGADSLKTEPLLLNVSTVELDPTQDYFDIKKPLEPPFDLWYWLKKVWLWAAIAAVLMAIALWLWLRKRKKKARVEIVDNRTPAQRARDVLTEIEAQRLWQAGQVKTYYSRTTDALRIYLEERFAINAMEMVSDELLDELQAKIPETAWQMLKTALRDADAVKFAKATPEVETHIRLMDYARQIINLTEPSPDEVAG